MNRGRQQGFSIGGYTIVETLIFLAISSAILLAAVVLISGRQARAQFQTGVRDFETRLTDIANDVATGYYQNSGTTKGCVEGANGPQFSGVDTDLGENQNCVFVGTIVKLGDGASDENFVQLTMAGLRRSSGANVTTLGQAKPQVLDNGTGFTSRPLGAGVRVDCVAVDGLNGGACMPNENAAIGFFTTFEGASLDGQGGAVQANVISYGSLVSKSKTAEETKTLINGFTAYDSAQLNRQITICLVGGVNQHALVRLAGNASSGLSVTSEIEEGGSC